MTRSAFHESAASVALLPRIPAARNAASGSRSIGVEDVRHPVALDQARRSPGPDVADPSQVGEHRLGVGGRQRQRLTHLHLWAVPTVIHPLAADVCAIAFLEMDERPHQHDRSVADVGVENGKTGLLAGVACPPYRHLTVEEFDHPGHGNLPPGDDRRNETDPSQIRSRTARRPMISRVDFVAMPTRDLERAVAFYGETLGLQRSVYRPERHHAEFEIGNLTLNVMNPVAMGLGARRVPERLRPPRRRRRGRARGTRGPGRRVRLATRSTPGSATWRSSRTRMATRSCSTTATPLRLPRG